MKIYNLPVEITFDTDTYIARCPYIQGAFASGDTPDEALRELSEVMKMIKDLRKEEYTEYSVETSKIFTNLPVLA